MKITFVSHASFWLESKNVTLLCDPWTKGKPFNEAWALLSPSAEVPYEQVDYVWISHEHPDHFSFPTLKAIPESDRRRITVLYQKHSSPRIVDALHKLNFDHVRELPLYRWITLKPGFDIVCGSVGSMDSFLAVRSEGECVLNLNDCVLNPMQTRYLRRLVGRVSLLFTQFSFANWIGNYSDEMGAVQQKLDDLQFRIDTFHPESTIPFASFMYFCDQENSWMNRLMVTPARIALMNFPGVHFMYPGDEWDSKIRTFQSADAVAKYMRDIERIKIDPTRPGVEEEKIRDAVLKMLGALHKHFGKTILTRIHPFEIYVHDLNRMFSIFPAQVRCDVRDATAESAAGARFVMCSQVAWYTFKHTWGWNTLETSGMYLDRKFEESGLIARCINALSTDTFNFSSLARFTRTTGFVWEKKFELLYNFLGTSRREYVNNTLFSAAILRNGTVEFCRNIKTMARIFSNVIGR